MISDKERDRQIDSLITDAANQAMKETYELLLQRREEARKTCKWKLDDDGFWETDCGHGFALNDGTLGENRMAFCPYCGHHIEEVQP